MTRVVGLTGGIGTGKSTVARLFATLGAVVIDADAIVHELQAPGMPLLARIAAAFGPEVLRTDGSLDRERVGRVVFSDPVARKRLEDLVHPAVGAEMVRRLAAARAAGAPLVVLDIPLLLEGRARRLAEARAAGNRREDDPSVSPRSEAKPSEVKTASDLVSEVIVVYAPESAQVERQVARDGATREHATERVRSQLSIEEKRRLADHVIDNSGALADTERQVRELFAKLT